MIIRRVKQHGPQTRVAILKPPYNGIALTDLCKPPPVRIEGKDTLDLTPHHSRCSLAIGLDDHLLTSRLHQRPGSPLLAIQAVREEGELQAFSGPPPS